MTTAHPALEPRYFARVGVASKFRSNWKAPSKESRRPRHLATPTEPKRSILAALIAAAVTLLVVVGANTFLVRAFVVPSSSMSPTLVEGEWSLVGLLDRDIQRGDVVVFTDDEGWLLGMPGVAASPDDSGSDGYLVKRVIAVGGDEVKCCDLAGKITVNGVQLEEPYLPESVVGAAASEAPFSAVVPEGRLWVMGDNRDASADSRAHVTDDSDGTIAAGSVIGKLFAHWRFEVSLEAGVR